MSTGGHEKVGCVTAGPSRADNAHISMEGSFDQLTRLIVVKDYLVLQVSTHSCGLHFYHMWMLAGLAKHVYSLQRKAILSAACHLWPWSWFLLVCAP